MDSRSTVTRPPVRRPAPLRMAPAGAVRACGLALAVVLAAGCAAPRDDDLYGLNLEVRSRQPWASDPALDRRVHDLVAASCAYHGLDPSLLYGMTLRIEDDGISCGTVAGARGCTWRGLGVMAVSTLAWTSAEPAVPCVEDTPIPHELLHVKIGDPDHADPRWRDAAYWQGLSARLARTGCSGDPPSLLW